MIAPYYRYIYCFLFKNGQETLKYMVNRDINGVLNWADGNGNGLDYIVKFIAKLLDPSQPESSAIFVGDLIVQLVRKAGSHMMPVLPQLLTAVIHRLSTAKMPSFIQVS